MAVTLAQSFLVVSAAADTSTLTTASFTPGIGDVIIVKAVSESVATSAAVPSDTSGNTYASRANDTTAAHCYTRISTSTVTVSAALTVSSTFSGSAGFHSMIVERWTGASLAGSPAINGTKTGTGAPVSSITTTGANSVVSWLVGDFAAVSPASRTYNTTSATPVEDGIHDKSTGNYVAYYVHQPAASAASQTLGITAPTGQTWTLLGIEILATGGPASDQNQYQPFVPWRANRGWRQRANFLSTFELFAARDVATGTTATADVAAAVAAAPDGSASIELTADQAAASGAAPDGTAGVGAVADVTPGSGAALDGSVTVAATADVGSGAGAAPDASTALTVTADVGSGAGTALDATVSTVPATSASADVATGSGAAPDASVAVAVTAGVATVSGAALDAAVRVEATAAPGTGTGAAPDASTAIVAGADQATGTGAALDATVSTSAGSTAPADVTPGAGTAFDVSAAVSVTVDVATGTGAAPDATGAGSAGTTASAGVATGVAAAFDAIIRIEVAAGWAPGSGAAVDVPPLTPFGGTIEQTSRAVPVLEVSGRTAASFTGDGRTVAGMTVSDRAAPTLTKGA